MADAKNVKVTTRHKIAFVISIVIVGLLIAAILYNAVKVIPEGDTEKVKCIHYASFNFICRNVLPLLRLLFHLLQLSRFP